jgi:hypothetical protein
MPDNPADAVGHANRPQATVIPAKAGIHHPSQQGRVPAHSASWVPAFAGMTVLASPA